MGTYIMKIFFTVLLCFSHGILSILGFNSASRVKCIERERQALLNFKQGLTDVSGMLSTWTDDEKNSDCCTWKGIHCNNETGQVHMLHLRGSDTHFLIGLINISLLIDLQNIQHLDLSCHNFSGSQIPKHMGSLKNLIYLDLSRLDLTGKIPYQLGNLSKLKYLDLSCNSFVGSIPCELGNLSKLEYLDLKVNYFDGAIPSQLGELTRLRYLDLSSNYIRGKIPYQLRNLSQLKYLDLWGNILFGTIPFQVGNLPTLHTLGLEGHFDLKIDDAKWLSSLSSLRTLHISVSNLGSSRYWKQMIIELIPNLRELSLTHCNLTDTSILVSPDSIKNSSFSLVTLDLSHNLLKSSAIFYWLSNFTTNLHTLSLSYNLLEGSIPDGFGNVMNSLEHINLNVNKLQGQIPASIGNICTLQELYLESNKLQGEIPTSIGNISTLQQLHLDNNKLQGEIPASLGNIYSLKEIYISNNQLNGEIPKCIGLLHELEALYLEGNNLDGDITELHLSNLSKLEVLDLTDNSLSLKFVDNWIPPFQLYDLVLGSCKLGPSFPSWLHSQTRLQFLDISDAGIDDLVPDWFWNKLHSIRRLNMSHNSLKGTIPNLQIKVPDAVIVINSNQFEGKIPSFLSQAETLDLSENKISNFKAFLCTKKITTGMITLDLSNNQIMGQLPNCWKHLRTLEYLDLSSNKLSGKIPQSMGTLVDLRALVLRNNSLTGDLPFTLKKCTLLNILDVSENLLCGPIPSWIGESLQQLQILSLRENRFFGTIPVHLCCISQICLLDLSRNHLSGGIPTCLKNFTAMMAIEIIARGRDTYRKMSSTVIDDLVYDLNVLFMWKGKDYMFWNPDFLLSSIDLSGNNLTGEIPKEIGLVSLNLSRNNLNGEIPSGIGSLNSLDFLDLSRNHLFGKIPSTLSKIDRLAVLDLSNNDLIGRIPWGRQLQTFDASSFEGNDGLCGEQLNKSCPGEETTTKAQGAALYGEDNNSFDGALYMSLSLGFFTGFWGLIGSILLWQPWRISYLRFLNRATNYILMKCRRWFKGSVVHISVNFFL
ncbi:hypothetical protein Fmac_016050 [Flemingia macrophylla]|uniref:Leucine-rich repeat-containing N-terminal plant-type domain-containing protein n=1 Tax=Flemingia macrophylla TaxID=520843 RepID=A0ABD1MGD1_9FABA